MDAVPVTLGQEFCGYARQIEAGIERVRRRCPGWVSWRSAAPPSAPASTRPTASAPRWSRCWSPRPGWPNCARRSNSFEAQAARDGLVEASGALRTIAVSLTKIANDIRWMGSGPLTGLAEIQLPDLQPGSSIMPGKVNPVLPEAVTQVAAQVIGNDAAVAVGGAVGRVRAQRLHPDDGPQHPRVVQAADQRVDAVRRALHRRAGRQRRAPARAGRVVAVDRDAAELGDRLRRGRRGGQASAQGAARRFGRR